MPIDRQHGHFVPSCPPTCCREKGDGKKAPHELVKVPDSTRSAIGEKHILGLGNVVRSRMFEVVVGALVVSNCVTMGVEAEMLLGKAVGVKAFVEVSDHVFTILFLVELAARVIVFGWQSFLPMAGGNLWNFLDVFLVLVTGVFMVWVLPLFGGTGGGAMRVCGVLRAFRLFRLVRLVRKLKPFREVWMLIRGLKKSLRILFWAIVLVFFITYIFAVFGVVLISSHIKAEYENLSSRIDARTEELEDLLEVTNGVLPLMHTLVQVLTLDSWNSIARPMMRYLPWSFCYFYLYISCAVIVMMNLVTAVIVENALANSQLDAAEQVAEREFERQKELEYLRQVYEQMDLDGDGQLTRAEFDAAFEDQELCNKLSLLGIEQKDCRDVFKLLDTGDGLLSRNEFFEGIARMDGPGQAKDLFRNTKTTELLVRLVCQQSKEVQDDLAELMRHMPGAEKRRRKGTLMQRACSTVADQPDIFMTDTSVHTDLSSSLPLTGKSGHVPIQSGAEQSGDLARVLTRLDEVVGLVTACNHNVEMCNSRVQMLSSEVSEFRRCSAGCPQR